MTQSRCWKMHRFDCFAMREGSGSLFEEATERSISAKVVLWVECQL